VSQRLPSWKCTTDPQQSRPLFPPRGDVFITVELPANRHTPPCFFLVVSQPSWRVVVSSRILFLRTVAPPRLIYFLRFFSFAHLNSCVYRLVAHVPCARDSRHGRLCRKPRSFTRQRVPPARFYAVRTVAYLQSCLIFSRSTTGFGITFLQSSTSVRTHAQYSVVIPSTTIVPDQV
jgi:hypothetical protein